MDAEEWNDWLNAIIAQYNAGTKTAAERDAAQRQYDLAMAQLGASTTTTTKLIGAAVLLGGIYLFAKYGR